jgi:hypothetical protein
MTDDTINVRPELVERLFMVRQAHHELLMVLTFALSWGTVTVPQHSLLGRLADVGQSIIRLFSKQ